MLYAKRLQYVDSFLLFHRSMPKRLACVLQPNRKTHARLLQGEMRIVNASKQPTRGKDHSMKLALHIIAPIAAIGLIALCLISQAPVLEKIR